MGKPRSSLRMAKASVPLVAFGTFLNYLAKNKKEGVKNAVPNVNVVPETTPVAKTYNDYFQEELNRLAALKNNSKTNLNSVPSESNKIIG